MGRTFPGTAIQSLKLNGKSLPKCCEFLELPISTSKFLAVLAKASRRIILKSSRRI